jgi:hexosaminidase
VKNLYSFWFLVTCFIASGQVIQVVPRPQSVAIEGAPIAVAGNLYVVATPALSGEADLIRTWWNTTKTDAKAGAVSAELRIQQGVPAEAYALRVSEGKIVVAGGSAAAVFYGIQTLIQAENGSKTLPAMTVRDQPAFAYRGMHLDVCRHFFDVDFVKRYLDLMAEHKMNRFHWHLTEDQGWRIEIKRYPRLTEVGAWRNASQVGPYGDQRFDSARYGGFYTHDEVREIVAYAAARHITVVPEIELPGHARAALAAYPHLSCTGQELPVATGWGVFDDVYCAGNDSVFTFLEGVLDEVLALFPGEYVHIGGDECPKTRWHDCAKCQARLKAEGLADEHALQSYFIRRIEGYLNARGRQIIGWDEILEGGLAPNATVMSWRGEAGGIAAAKAGHDAIMTPGKPCYWDHYQSKDAGEPHAIGGFNPVESVFLYNPVPAELSAEEAKHILGAQANLWTEYVLTPAHAEYMILPRQLALAEVLWTGPRRSEDLPEFRIRATQRSRSLKARGFNVAPHFLLPESESSRRREPK